MKRIYLLTFILLLPLCTFAQIEAQTEEAKIAELSTKSYNKRKIIPQYLKVYRLYNGEKCKADRKRILNSVSDFLLDYKTFSSEALTLDSLQDLAFSEFKKEDAYLCLLEDCIVNLRGSNDSYKHCFALYQRAVTIRGERNLLKGKDYEKLLRWYAGHMFYDKSLSYGDKESIYQNLWTVYLDNNTNKDSLDEKLLDSYINAAGMAKNYTKQVELQELMKDYLEKTDRKDSELWYKTLKSLGFTYSNLIGYPEVLDNTKKEYLRKELAYKEICIRHNMVEAIQSDDLASDLSMYLYGKLSQEKDTTSARALVQEYATKLSQNVEEDSEKNLKALDMLASTYSDYDKEKIPLLKRMLAIEEKLYGKDDIKYKGTSASLDMVYMNNNDKGSAIQNMSSNMSSEDPLSLMSLGSQQYLYGKYKDAITTEIKLLEYTANHSETRGTYLLSSVMSIGNCYHAINDTQSLVEFAKKWSSDTRFSYEERKFILSSPLGMASLPGYANSSFIDVIDDFMKQNPVETARHLDFAQLTELKASILFGLGKYSDAENACARISALYATAGTLDFKMMLKYKIYQEICLFVQKKINEALSLNQQSLNQIKSIPGYETLAEYKSLCCRTCWYYDKLEKPQEVMKYADIVHTMNKNNWTSMFPDDILGINNFTGMSTMLTEDVIINMEIKALCQLGMISKAKEKAKAYIQKEESTIRFSLSQLDQSSMTRDDSYISQLSKMIIAVAAMDNDSEMNIMAYNFQLLYKQAFLAAEASMRQQLLNSGNENLKKKFNDLQSIKTSIQQTKALGLPTDNLYQSMVELQQQVKEDSKMYGDFTKSLNATWQDVRNVLTKEDLAVEFVEYTSFVDGKKKIGALMMDNASKAPELLELCQEEDLTKEPTMESVNVSKLIWSQLFNKYPNKKNIFFAATGLIYNIPVESLPMPDGIGYVSDKYVLNRISSTRELLNRQDNTHIVNACLFGGLNYDMSVNEMAKNNNNTPTPAGKINRQVLRSSVESIPYLPGTKTEVEQISKVCGQSLVNCQLLEGSNGTEDKIKALSGGNLDFLHLATHGFYIKGETEDSNNLVILTNQTSEDNMMTRAGIFLSGAQNVINGEILPEGVADGVLTSQEISTLDLHNLNLVTLSACQTAQGDIAADGVFGLQRGFKKAGVHSILMSLWSVDDAATCKLMTEFYINWISKKMTKHDALETAKKTVRETKGWEDPKYWAAFILLDGLD